MTDTLQAGAELKPGPVRLSPPVPSSPTRGTRAIPLAGLAASISSALEHRRLFLLWPYGLVAGLVAAVAVPEMPPPWALAAVGAILAVLLAALHNRLALLRLLSLVAMAWLGFCLLPIHGALFGTTMLARPAYGTYEMRVDEIVSATGDEVRAIASTITPAGDARSLPIRRARVVIRAGSGLAPGDIIRAPVRFYGVPGPVVPNGFDTQFHAYFDGVGAYGNTTGGFERLAVGDASAPERVIDSIRRAIAAHIDAHLRQPAAGIARALINGDQSAVSDEARDTMASAGLAHVLSVSGLHLTIVAGLVLVALRMGLATIGPIHGLVPVKRVAAGGAVLAALGYFAISGGNVAALRSTIMLVLVLGAIVFGRRALTMRNVAIAGLLVIVTDPSSIFRPSFQLSFAAVVALIAAWEMMRHHDERNRSIVAKVGGYLWGIVLTSVIAGLATLLFSVYHFQQTSPLGVLGNLVSLPLVAFVMMPSAVVAALLMPLGWEAPFLAIMGWSIDVMLALGHIVAGWSAGLDHSPLLTPLALGIGTAAFAWFTFLPTWHRLIGPAAAIPLIVLVALDNPPDLLIADTTQAIAMRVEGDMALVSGKSDSFAVDVWRETYSVPIEANSPLSCDSIGCFGLSPSGFAVALVKDPAGFYEDCAMADIVIARRSVPSTCSAPTVIDADTLARGGVQWLRWDQAARRFDVRPAVPPVNRPWRVAPP